MWQVQWSTDSKDRMESVLNPNPLVGKEKEMIGRYMLYPTGNIWNFVLLDQITGITWQVQWSTDVEGRIVVPIF